MSNSYLSLVKPWSQDWLIAAGAFRGFCSMKRLGAALSSGQFPLSKWKDEAWNRARVFPTSFSGDVTLKLAGTTGDEATSFPGSLFSASLGRWKKDPGCGWSRAKLWHKLSHRGRVNQQFLSISTEAKERSFEIFQSCCKPHTGQMKYICIYLAYQPAAGRSVYCFAVSCSLN